jgi:peroxiredoxin
MITPGSKMPAVPVKLVTAEGVTDVTSEKACAGSRVVVFTLPGAFTPTCSNNHLPGYQINADKLRAAGVSRIICATWNDQYVVKAWAESTGSLSVMDFIADGNGELARALGLDHDRTSAGMGTRYVRAALIVEDGIIRHVAAETENGVVAASGANAILDVLRAQVA